MMEQPVLEVEGLCAGYGTIPVLRQVSFAVRRGEVVGVLGHNGMGKTTLMKALVGQVDTTAGEIRLAGKPARALPTHQRAALGLGYVPQGRDIFASLSVRENLAIGAAAARRQVAAAVDGAVTDFPVLGRLLERKGGALSGGEQQILALARALCGAPRVLLLDEPTEGIQPSIVDEIEDHLCRLAAERGLAVVVVEQDVGFIRSIAQRVLWLQKGEIIRELKPELLSEQETLDEFVGLESAGEP